MRILLSLLRRPWRGRSGHRPWRDLTLYRPWRGLTLPLWHRPEPRPHRRRAGRRWSERPPNGGWYRSQACRPLTARQVEERQFGLVKRGLDPVEVHAFLHRVAADLAAARRDLALTREENQRIKRALRSWRTHFTSDVRW
ncbi:DivIVA domain-containing protein [Micromonospora sp. CA-248260]|uniref:DivIVA domain-containing protein n=1 Tax=Micromonospora sp. CA-248260 TaxID=3239962 RepID=UPI003D8B7D06